MYPLCFCLKIVGSFSQLLIIHLVWILAEKILHQSPERRIITIRTIDVEDMRPIIKRSLKLLYDSIHMVKRTTRSIDVVFCNEDHPCLWKFRELRSFCQFPRIHHAAVVACPTRSGTLVGTLYLAVVELSLAVLRQNIKTHAATIEIVRTLLRDDMLDNEIVAVKEDTQQELHSLDIVVKTYVEKRIVYQAEFLNQHTIFRRNVLLDYPHRAYSLLTLFYYHSMHYAKDCQD